MDELFVEPARLTGPKDNTRGFARLKIREMAGFADLASGDGGSLDILNRVNHIARQLRVNSVVSDGSTILPTLMLDLCELIRDDIMSRMAVANSSRSRFSRLYLRSVPRKKLAMRELKVLSLMGENKDAQQIASELGIKISTVISYISQIKRVVGVDGNEDVVEVAKQKGLI